MKNLIIRTAVLVVLWANMLLVNKGVSPLPIDESGATELVSDILAGLATIWTWWKNNNVTKAAQEGQRITDELKSENVAGNLANEGEADDDTPEDVEEE